MKWLFGLIGTALFVLPHIVFGSVTVNEIAWMGNTNSASDEWIELYNTEGVDVDLTDWALDAVDGTPAVVLSGLIRANGYFLLERTNDDSVSGIVADQVYVGALGNGGENLSLKDSNGSVMDVVDASGGWPAGDNDTKHTMQRVNSSWITAASTPKKENVFSATPPPAPIPQVISPSPAPTPQPVSPSPNPIPQPSPVPVAQPASRMPSAPVQVTAVENIKSAKVPATSNTVKQSQQEVVVNSNSQQKKIVVAPQKVRAEESKKIPTKDSEALGMQVLMADVASADEGTKLYGWFLASILVGLGVGILGVKIKNRYTTV